MLHRLGWRWDACGTGVALSEDGLVATKHHAGRYQLVTGGSPMTEGRHYWEVELSKISVFVGAVRPGLDHDKYHMDTNDAYFIAGNNGALFGNGKSYGDQQDQFADGDRIGVLLDLDAGWLRYYRNGKRCGPGYTEGVTGPLLRAAQFVSDTVTVLPGAVAPQGAGDTDEPLGDGVHISSFSLAQLKDACRAKGLHARGKKAVLRARLEAAAPPPQ
jgi:hypothetical protein